MKPEWESPGAFTIADALDRARIALGPGAQVNITVRVEAIPSVEERHQARIEFDALPPRPKHQSDHEFPPDTTIEEVRRIQREQYEAWELWDTKRRTLEQIAYPYHYSVGYRADAARMSLGREYSRGVTWEEALKAADIADPPVRLPDYLRR